MELVREPDEELAALPVHTHIPEPGRGLQEELGGLPCRRRADGAPNCLQDSRILVVSELSVMSSLELDLAIPRVPTASSRTVPRV